MIIKDQIIIIKWNAKLVKHYIEKGYDFSKKNKEIKVKIEDLTEGSKVLVKCICDYCGKEFELPYKKAIKQNKHPCNPKCVALKTKENVKNKYGVENVAQLESSKEKTKKHFIEKYGVDNPLKYDIIKQKIKQTNLQRYGNECSMNGITKEKIKQNNLQKYGVEYYSQTNEYKEKYKQTSLERYGTQHPWQSDKVKEKIKDTNLERYGVECTLQSEYIKQKIKDTCVDKYGVENPAQAIEVKEKIAQSLYQNETGISSKNQRYLCNLFQGKLNYPIGFYKLDIAFLDKKIYIEYDGSGHNLRVQRGYINEKKFKKQEVNRKLYLEKKGWKIIRIISKYDKLLDDNIIINLVNKAKDYLLNTNHTWFEIDIDNKLIKCAEYIMEV